MNPPASISDREAMEKWRPIPAYPRYEVSDSGKVRIVKTRKMMKLRASVYGYLRVSLTNKNGPKGHAVHRLVLSAFVSEQPPGHQVGHINGKRADNRLCNLKWCTPKENAADRIRHGTQASRDNHGSARLSESDIAYIRKNYQRFAYNKSNSKELAKKFNVTKWTIVEIVRGRTWNPKALSQFESRK